MKCQSSFRSFASVRHIVAAKWHILPKVNSITSFGGRNDVSSYGLEGNRRPSGLGPINWEFVPALSQVVGVIGRS